MLNIQPGIENATDLPDSSTEYKVWLPDTQSLDSIQEDGSSRCGQIPGISQNALHSPAQSSTKLSGKPDNLSEQSKHISGNLSQSPETDKDGSISSKELSIKITPSNENATALKNTSEILLSPTCRDGSSLSSISDEETELSKNSYKIILSSEVSDISKNTLETSPQSKYIDGSLSTLDSEDNNSMSLTVKPPEEIGINLSKNTMEMALAPTCKDGSSLSLYSDDESATVSETALATIGYNSELGSSSSDSDIDEDNVLSQLPRNLVAQTPQVLVDNSSDVHIGPHFQYSGPITVKQYITLNGKDAIESDNAILSSKVPTEMPHLKEIVNIALKPQVKDGNKSDLTDVSQVNSTDNFVVNGSYSPNTANLNDGIKTNGIYIPEDVVFSGSKVTLLNVKKNFLRPRCIVISFIVIVVLCVCISLSLVLPDRTYSSQTVPVKRHNINMTAKFKDLKVSEGEKTIQWVVEITSSIGILKADWYGPGCKFIEEKDGPSKYEVNNVYQKNGKMQTVLKVLNVTQSDMGQYKLRVYNNQDEKWDYFTLTVLGGNHIIACYVAAWAHLRRDQGKFTVENIDPTQCTHLIYAFANLSTENSTIYPSEPKYDLGTEHEKGAYEKMTSLKKKHPHLKVLISMGGWAQRTHENYSIVAESPAKRKDFIASVVEFIRKYNFDGFDLHWQYPTEQRGVPDDKQNFVYMIKELKEEFVNQGKQWLLTAPIGVMPDTIEGAYIIPEVTKYLDYMFALCYAYHGYWDKKTGPNAPLKPSIAGDKLNVEESIKELLRRGAQREKLVLGLPLYGRNFNLENEKDTEGFGSPTVGEGFTGPYVQEQGTYGYNEICYELGRTYSNWIVHWDTVTHTPYMTYKEKFMSYDNEKSLTEKVQFALNKKLAGVVAYSLDTDDFRGSCAFDKSGPVDYPLMRAINKAFTIAHGAQEPCENVYKHKPISNDVR